MRATVNFLVLMFAFIGILAVYFLWLNWGCPLDGYITWHGKECVSLMNSDIIQ